ncbi:hypothetical protein INR49_012277 [Caranx melampygus]|nr:hypothetical protein INR49_012277 [Caranx melampygus]
MEMLRFVEGSDYHSRHLGSIFTPQLIVSEVPTHLFSLTLGDEAQSLNLQITLDNLASLCYGNADRSLLPPREDSLPALGAILKHMGLQHKMTHSQASKKWENMKKRYKDLKSPPVGVKVFPETWPHFTLMDNALQGRLEGSAPILKALVTDKDNDDFLPVCKSKKRKVSMDTASSTASVAGGPEIEVSLNGGEDGEQGCMDIDRIMLEVDNERNVMDNERQAMAKEKQLMDRERQVLQRERAVLDREVAALDRDRASLERERAMIEREKVVMEREKAMVEKDKDAVCRERQALEREKARLERLYGSKERTEEAHQARQGHPTLAIQSSLTLLHRQYPPEGFLVWSEAAPPLVRDKIRDQSYLRNLGVSRTRDTRGPRASRDLYFSRDIYVSRDSNVP